MTADGSLYTRQAWRKGRLVFLLVLFLVCFFPVGKAPGAASVQQSEKDGRSGIAQADDSARPPDQKGTRLSAGDAPVAGDTLIYGMLGEPSNLVPYLSSDSASSQVAGNFYVAPLRYDKNLNVEAFAAESYEVLEDGKLLRFTLRKGLRWEDGVELSTDDVDFTYRMMTDPDTPTAYAGDFKIIKELRVLDRYRFEVVYDAPFPRSLSTWMGAILPRHKLEGQDLRGTPLARRPLSCGPYRMENWDAGVRISVTANPDYFEGRPFIDRILYRIIPDATTMFLELKAGKLDVMAGLTPLQYLYQAQTEEFQREYATYKELSSSYTYLGYNLKNPLFADRRVRVALAHAINKEDIIKGALMELGVPTIGPYRPDSWAYNRAIEDYPYDPGKALALLAKAGWTRGGDGLLQKNGTPFSFTLLTNQGNEQRINTALIIQNQLRKVGIEVKIRSVEWAAFLNQFVMPGHFDAVVLAWTQPYDPDGFDIWHSSRAAAGGLNFIGFADAEADALLDAGRRTLDREKRKSLYNRFQEILHREQPYTFLYVPYQLSAIQRRVRGVDPAPAGIFHNTNQWWVPLDEQRHRIAR